MIQEAFNQFLNRLNSDREFVGTEYEMLRRALIVFFEQHGRLSPEKLADETLNRIARVLKEGTKIDNLNTYALGVARNLLKENWHGPEEEPGLGKSPLGRFTSSNPEEAQQQPDLLQDNEIRLECMKKCLEELPTEDSRLIRKYYVTEYVRKEEQRKKLADQMGISLNSLRERILQIRATLEVCLNDCMG